MNSVDDAHYRLKLAEGFLREAKRALEITEWRWCVDSSQLCVENSGKAILSIFEPLEKTHEVVSEIRKLLERGLITGTLGDELNSILPLFRKLGKREHFLVDYGEEETYKKPWDIFDKESAEEALNIASKCFELAEKIVKTMTG